MEAPILVSWVAATDYRAMRGDPEVGLGPVAQVLVQPRFAEALLLNNYPPELAEAYQRWIGPQTAVPVRIHQISLPDPIDHAEIYRVVCAVLAELRASTARPLVFHLSPGTPAMASVWLLLAKTRYPASLIQSTRDGRIIEVDLPFDIAVDYLPELLAERDRRLRDASSEPPPPAPAFHQILCRSPQMRRVLAMARRVAIRDVPVLIEGESGTGKELLARACHHESPRRDQAFIAVNCGAIPEELVESELFGHEKGAFTGAHTSRPGHFRSAHRGTLFLDEIGELPMPVQVKLLRVLQEGEVTPVGASRPIPVDVRVIAATHRRLLEACREGRFREDLFYRLAVAVLVLPPLRERMGDLRLLVDQFLEELALEARALGEPAPTLCTGALAALRQHPWPGNVRELRNTLRRAHLWSEGGLITEEDIRQALLTGPPTGPLSGLGSRELLERPLGPPFSLPDLLGQVARHYLERAMAQAGGNKTEAARLLGLASHQTMGNWLKRHGLEGP
jgi:DNA-binding NtrC family response regulator